MLCRAIVWTDIDRLADSAGGAGWREVHACPCRCQSGRQGQGQGQEGNQEGWFNCPAGFPQVLFTLWHPGQHLMHSVSSKYPSSLAASAELPCRESRAGHVNLEKVNVCMQLYKGGVCQVSCALLIQPAWGSVAIVCSPQSSHVTFFPCSWQSRKASASYDTPETNAAGNVLVSCDDIRCVNA